MRVAVEAEASRCTRCCGRAHVDGVQPAFARAGADGVRESGLGVHRQRVCRTEAGVVRGFGEGHRRRGHAAKLREVEDLHAVVGGLTHDECVIGEDLDASPRRDSAPRWQVAEIHGRTRVRYVDERGSGGAADQRILATRERIGPAPDVIAASAADIAVRQKRHEVDVAARVNAGHAVGARGEGECIEALQWLCIGFLRAPARAAAAVRIKRTDATFAGAVRSEGWIEGGKTDDLGERDTGRRVPCQQPDSDRERRSQRDPGGGRREFRRHGGAWPEEPRRSYQSSGVGPQARRIDRIHASESPAIVGSYCGAQSVPVKSGLPVAFMIERTSTSARRTANGSEATRSGFARTDGAD